MRRVVITGLGLITPIGLSTKESWTNCINGVSGIKRATKIDIEKFPTKIAGEVNGFDPLKYGDQKIMKRLDSALQYAAAASFDAVKDACLQVESENPERVGVIIGSGIGGISNIYNTSVGFDKDGLRSVSPFFVPASIINNCSGYVAIRLGVKGPNYSVVSACATGNHAIADGFHSIRRDEADIMIVGGSEAGITELAFAGFCAARALSKRNDEPEKASRPFDKLRDGFVMGEGAGIFIIEEYEHAKQRNARIYAEILSCGMSGDAYHLTAPSEKGEGAARSMKTALDWANIRPDAIDYINAHGTSTELGDIAETDAIKTVFGQHAYKLAVSSTKSMTGHLLGAAAAIEAAFTALALHEGVIPPTINYEEPDPKCDLDYVPNKARKKEIEYAISNGFGFGGTNSSLVLIKI